MIEPASADLPGSGVLLHPELTARAEGMSAAEAFEYCRRYASSHYENFTVVSRFLPRRLRPHFFALYADCRFVDDLGDESAGDRLALLDAWEAALRRCYEGRPQHPILVALAETVRQYDIPIEPFLRLIEANRMDQRIHRYATYDDLLRYCRYSANPVGRLVLHLMGYTDEERRRLSDCTCTALQLTNFWQDVGRDLEKGRIYIPLEDMARCGYPEERLLTRVVNDAFRRLMALEVERARRLFEVGRRLEDLVDRRFRVDLRLFRLGGERILRAIERQGYDVLHRRPSLSKGEKLWLMLTTAARQALPLR
jgi:squalene synthase HpnC